MTTNDPGGAFAQIGQALLRTPGGPRRPLTINVGDRPVRLSLDECRNALYGPTRNERLGTAIWRQVVADARQEPRGGVGTGRLVVVWLAVPGLYRNLHRILRQSRVERADLEAEAVLALLAAIDTSEPDDPDAGGQMIKEAVNQMWAFANRVRREVPVIDIARFAESRNVTVAQDQPWQPADRWELHLTPPPRRDGLAATIRFAESPTRREGERVGALAYCVGLPDIVFRARRHDEADLIGTLVLHPARARR
ncbi:hypothetical protein ACFVUH_25550 [Kitasatospora sp. NPDC058032]|uniref:hypothetical protein n=1 Tax=Kitasatospora sp. NPDC058032 TaxID=3346307 RepID=UPI0036DCF0B8